MTVYSQHPCPKCGVPTDGAWTEPIHLDMCESCATAAQKRDRRKIEAFDAIVVARAEYLSKPRSVMTALLAFGRRLDEIIAAAEAGT
jgi:hypothetical protein